MLAMPSGRGSRIMSIADMPVPAPSRIHSHAIAMTTMRAATTTWRSRRRMASRAVSSAVVVIAAAGVERKEAGRAGALPVERGVLGRVEGVVELEAMRVYREDRRLAPSDELGSGAGLAAGCVHQLRILSGRAGGAADRLGPGLDLADDLDAPMSEIGSDFVGDLGALDAAALPPPGEGFVDPAGKTAGAAADDRRKRRHLPVIGIFVDIHAAHPSRL